MSERTQLFSKVLAGKGIISFLSLFHGKFLLVRAILCRFYQPVYHLYYIGDSIMFFHYYGGREKLPLSLKRDMVHNILTIVI